LAARDVLCLEDGTRTDRRRTALGTDRLDDVAADDGSNEPPFVQLAAHRSIGHTSVAKNCDAVRQIEDFVQTVRHVQDRDT
jgi:hypothetical protein